MRNRHIRRNSNSSGNGYTYYNKHFEDISDLFLFACTHGDYMLAHRLLQEGDVQADVCNRLGKSALQLAIENEHFEVVKVLLVTIPYEQFRDALLSAIYLGHTSIADFILNHPTYRTFSGGFLDPTDPCAYDESQFSSDITPLILASQHNRLQIVHQLLLRGERIKKPHNHLCSCDDCVKDLQLDSLRQGQVRLSAYKGLASEVYIALTYADPILQAFQLRRDLLILAKAEPHFDREYKQLARQLSMFVARLLDNVRGYEELEIVLNKTGLPQEEKYETLARFDLAIQFREKTFIAHPNCQQKLMEKWYENLSVIKNVDLPKRILFYSAFFICYPFIALTFFVFPESKVANLCRQPNLKFKVYIVSYFSFIGLIIASGFFSVYYLGKTKLLSNYDSTIYANYIRWIYSNENIRSAFTRQGENLTHTLISCDLSLRFIEPNPFQVAIFIWVLGFLWNEFKQIISVGLGIYLRVPSNYVDCSMNILYILHFIFLFASMVYTRLALNTFRSQSYWNQMSHYENMTNQEKNHYLAVTVHTIYWLNADRFFWQNGDVHNLSEAFFAMGNVVSICRICFLLPIIQFVGPLQVMLERMIIDIAKWSVMMFIFFLAFACALFFIYSPYSVTLNQRTILNDLQINHSTLITNNRTSKYSTSDRCPDIFYQMTNESNSFFFNSSKISTVNINTNENYCSSSNKYDELLAIGPYPAIHYFGKSFQSTTLTTFFTLFGVIGADDIPDRGYELLPLSCYRPNPLSYLPNFDEFVTSIGFILYGMFTFICVTVLINTLIVMLEQSIDKIDDDADAEWKFARSKLYMEYIREGNTLPVPMNIFPSPKAMFEWFHKITSFLFWKKIFQKRTSSRSSKSIDLERSIRLGQRRSTNAFVNDKNLPKPSHETLTYQIVMERIVKRFLLYYQTSHQGLDEVKDGFEFKEVKQDISSMRFEISHALDVVDDMYGSLKQSMATFNGNLENQFSIGEMKKTISSAKNQSQSTIKR